MKSVGLFCLAVVVHVLRATVDGAEYSSFSASTSSDSEPVEFYHAAVDPVTGSIFVGARNRLHHLDAELRPLRTVVTGPRLDNRRCTESFGAARCGAGGSTVFTAVPTDNVNKVRANQFRTQTQRDYLYCASSCENPVMRFVPCEQKCST